MKHVYGPYSNGKPDRLIMVFWDSETNTHGSQSYPRFLMEQKLGRELRDDEEVHHKDEDRTNNSLDNLTVLSTAEHNRIHHRESKRNRDCELCGKRTRNLKYCSVTCARLGDRKVDRPSRAQLEEDLSSMSYVAVGRKYGVSDNAVRKWLKGV